MNSWTKYKLGDLATIQTGPFGSQLHAKDYVAKGVPVIMPINIVDHKLSYDGIAQIRESDAQRLKKHLVKEGEIVFSRRGEIERRAIIKNEHSNWLCGTGCLKVTLNEKSVNPTFLYYRIGTEEVKEWLYNHAVGATMPNLNTDILSNLPLDVPDKCVQTKIASILSSLDDKIELNRRMNQTLEQTAGTLFKKYFVDDIDPDNLPEGWGLGKLNEMIELVYGKALKEADRKGGLFPVVGSSGIVGYHDQYLAEGEGIVVGRKGNAGSVIWLHERFYPIDTTFYVKDLLGMNGLYFYYFLLQDLNLNSLNSDSAVPGLNRNDAHN